MSWEGQTGDGSALHVANAGNGVSLRFGKILNDVFKLDIKHLKTYSNF